MKLYVGMIAYNEELLIEASLKSIYPYVDEIVVIDGSSQGPSFDATAKIAASVGPKVKVTSGTFMQPLGIDHKLIQRSACLDHMEKSHDNWCVTHDADEVWDEENIQRLTTYMRTAPRETLLFSYQWLHFIVDCWHTIHGGQWTQPRELGAFRLVPGIRYTNHHRVSINAEGRETHLINLGSQPPSAHITLEDVMFFHYGHAQTKEKTEAKAHFYFDRDLKCREGYGINEWEQYRKGHFIPWLGKRLTLPNVRRYDGPHPKWVQSLIGTFWRKDE